MALFWRDEESRFLDCADLHFMKVVLARNDRKVALAEL
jgi:hypothetical protein